jgi:hypothetical protein
MRVRTSIWRLSLVTSLALGAGVMVGGAVASHASAQTTSLTDPEALLFAAAAPLDLNEPLPPPFVAPMERGPVAIIARADWDDEPSRLPRLRRRTRPLSSSTHIVVHHSDFASSPGPEAINAYHRTQAGFADIGYHFVVGHDGDVYEARALDRVGAHAGVTVEQRRNQRLDPDEDSVGIVLDGDFADVRPDPRQLAAAARLIRDLRARYRIPARQVIGHRDVRARLVEARGLTLAGDGTVCPGDAAFELVPALRLLSEPSNTEPS